MQSVLALDIFAPFLPYNQLRGKLDWLGSVWEWAVRGQTPLGCIAKLVPLG